MWRALSATSCATSALASGSATDGTRAEKRSPNAHAVGIAGEHLAEAVAIVEDLAEFGVVLECHVRVYFRKRWIAVS